MASYSDSKTNDPRFPGSTPSGQPPTPSAENPGQVFPATSDSGISDNSKRSSPPNWHNESRTVPDHLLGNPFLMRHALEKMDNAIFDVIRILKQEIKGHGESSGEGILQKNTAERALLNKLEGWRKELEPIVVEHNARRLSGNKDNGIVSPTSSLTTQEGGMFTD
ncbi:hypothetical protein FA15DRAFT_664461 [Coprinopsis marcescibilis]|uniref:Uncharacterized protein n=1 Tax=Coprinopsis marcescibilis TaxID=230819 RepID=A0A5C3LAU3_COPMA|nr:hypothetical protein FA15DRAFT_664461 [Coprinopsis marcescibilis]